jgi:hypothetical protein
MPAPAAAIMRGSRRAGSSYHHQLPTMLSAAARMASRGTARTNGAPLRAVVPPLRGRGRRRAASSSSSSPCPDSLAVWLQWDDWLGEGHAMTGDGETQEDADSFVFERQMEPQSYFLHVGAPEFAPHQALSERLYSVGEDFEAEDSTQLSGESRPPI